MLKACLCGSIDNVRQSTKNPDNITRSVRLVPRKTGNSCTCAVAELNITVGLKVSSACGMAHDYLACAITIRV